MKTGISYLLRSAFAKAAADRHDSSRRAFIRKSAFASVALSLPFVSCQSVHEPTVTIVGAGLAGMTASLHLAKAGINHTVYEAAERLGGRILTVQDAVIPGAHIDFGAEFIDSTHDELLSLAKELNVEIVDLHEDPLIPKAYSFAGKMYTEKDIVDALQPFAARLHADVTRLPEFFHYSESNTFADLDKLSVSSYLENIGITGWLRVFLETAIEGEYAMNASEQSAINMLVMLSVPVIYDEHYHLLGNYHEVFKFKGGSSKFSEALAARVKGDVKTGHQLKSIRRQGKQYRLTFSAREKSEDIITDYLLLAIPLPILHDIEKDFEFTRRKEQWISEAGFGNAVKVAAGFNSRPWRVAGYQGYTFTDINRTMFWDSSQMVNTEAGSLTFTGGGSTADELAQKPYQQLMDDLLPRIDGIFNGAQQQYNGKVSRFPWKIYPFSKGSYTAYKKGQWSRFAGVEAEPFENILFAGEHCSVKHQGFMNGAVETGKLAAQSILNAVKMKNEHV